MFNRGRPKKHAHIAFFTYEAPDGMVLSYEMSNKGPLKQVDHPNSPRIVLKDQTRIITDDSQNDIKSNENNEIPLSDNQLGTLQNKLSMSSSISNQDLYFQNINIGSNYTDMLNTDLSLDNNSLDEDFFNCDTFLNSENKLDNALDDQYFGGLSDYPNTELKSAIDDEDYFKF